MHGTRERILELMIRHREARVEDFAEQLDITPAAVRRHLDNLRADGMADMRAVKQATGRPYYVYFATGKGLSSGAVAYAELLERMLLGLGDQADVLPGVTERMAQSLAEKHRTELAGMESGTAEERVSRVTESLRKDGILDEWRSEDDGYHLVNGACPYRKAAEISRLPCDSDRKTIELLLGLDVEQIDRIVDGSPVCEYLVRAVHDPNQSIIEAH
jgi:predicted ArsR family transcriptional regulator